MEALYKKGDGFTPEIEFDPENNVFSIKGKSIPVDAHQFFADVISWLERYSEEPNESTRIEIDLEYLNATSIKTILNIMSKVKRIDERGKEVSVEWHVPREADDLRELSEDILTNLHIPHLITSN